MKARKAILTAAGRSQRSLPLQTLVDQQGATQSALAILLDEVISAGIEEIAVVICPGDAAAYAEAAGKHARLVTFIEQPEALGYGEAVHRAAAFTGGDAFLLMVGDHLYLSRGGSSCARQLVETAARENCPVSAVQATHESQLPVYGTIGGRRLQGHDGLYQIEQVIEKPTPTVAEQKLVVPGLRAGHYLCFFGLHVLTPRLMELLAAQLADPANGGRADLSKALAEFAAREKYLAVELQGRRHDIGRHYGLLAAQLALGLAGRDRDEVLALMVQVLADSHA